jgi:uncharacterized metal-binding protein
MANYKTHTRFNLCLFLPLLVTIGHYLLKLSPRELTLFGASFAYGTLWLSPDMDVAYQIKLFSFRGLMTLPFRPYAYIFKHRGLSHIPVIGTLTRVIWLLLIALALLIFVYEIKPTPQDFVSFCLSYKMILSLAFGGILFADLGHLLLDL